MSRIIPESELIINEDGSVYHLHLRPEDLGEVILLVGDPDRVAQVSMHFDSTDIIKRKREFITHTGHVGRKRVSVISTGIGTDNIDIVLNELDMLVNVDLQTKEVRPVLTSLPIIRIGTSGSVQADIEVDDLILSSYGLGLDSLLGFYHFQADEPTAAMLEEINEQLNMRAFQPYLFKAPGGLEDCFGSSIKRGITATCCGFYGPQGRMIRADVRFKDMIHRLNKVRCGAYRITNFEMETAAIYGMATLLGHRALSVNAILANRVEHKFSTNSAETIQRAIRLVLEKIEQIS